MTNYKFDAIVEHEPNIWRNAMDDIRSCLWEVLVWNFRILMFFALLVPIWIIIPIDVLEVQSIFAWLFIGSGLTLLSFYWLLFRPIHDGYRERRGKPLFRFSCLIMGHKWYVYTDPENSDIYWCSRCDLVGHGERNK